MRPLPFSNLTLRWASRQRSKISSFVYRSNKVTQLQKLSSFELSLHCTFNYLYFHSLKLPSISCSACSSLITGGCPDKNCVNLKERQLLGMWMQWLGMRTQWFGMWTLAYIVIWIMDIASWYVDIVTVNIRVSLCTVDATSKTGLKDHPILYHTICG